MRASLELLTYPYGRNRAKTPVRSLRGIAKEGQSNKKMLRQRRKNTANLQTLFGGRFWPKIEEGFIINKYIEALKIVSTVCRW